MRIGDAGCRGECWSRLIVLHPIRRMLFRKVVLKTVYFSKALIQKDLKQKPGPNPLQISTVKPLSVRRNTTLGKIQERLGVHFRPWENQIHVPGSQRLVSRLTQHIPEIRRHRQIPSFVKLLI